MGPIHLAWGGNGAAGLTACGLLYFAHEDLLRVVLDRRRAGCKNCRRRKAWPKYNV